MKSSITAFVLSAFLAACGGDSTAEDTCKRADDCNALNGSIKECVETIDNVLDQLTATEADELEFQMTECLDHPSCGSFLSCFNAIVDRRSSGGGGGGGSGPGSGDDPPAPSGPS